MSKRLGFAVDIGATRVRVCIGDEEGKIVYKIQREMQIHENVEDYVKDLVRLVREVVERRPEGAEADIIGVGSIGPLDPKRGGIAGTANLPYAFLPVVEPLREAFGRDVVLLNDANAGALAEHVFGAGKSHPNMVYVTISTGIGGGAIVDGHLLIGKDGNAAEVGHMTIDILCRLTCGCGKKGHWEAYCSGRNIPNFARLLLEGLSASELKAYLPSKISEKRSELMSPIIFQEAFGGDKLAQYVVDEVGKLNSIALANLINVYDPSLITIGGPVALKNPDLIMEPLRRYTSSHVINRMPEIRITPLGEDVVLLGALAAALNPATVISQT